MDTTVDEVFPGSHSRSAMFRSVELADLLEEEIAAVRAEMQAADEADEDELVIGVHTRGTGLSESPEGGGTVRMVRFEPVSSITTE